MGVQEKKNMAEVEEKLKKSVSEVTSTEKSLTASFDWEAYNQLAWDKIGKDRVEHMRLVASSVTELGKGINNLCKDAAYKEAFGSVTKIIVKASDVKGYVVASVQGDTIHIEVNAFGSTRRADDYEKAIKKALA